MSAVQAVAGEARDLRRNAVATPHRPAIICGAERLTYAELEALANRMAASLRGLGLVRGDHVASLIRKRPEGGAGGSAAGWRGRRPSADRQSPRGRRRLLGGLASRAVPHADGDRPDGERIALP